MQNFILNKLMILIYKLVNTDIEIENHLKIDKRQGSSQDVSPKNSFIIL